MDKNNICFEILVIKSGILGVTLDVKSGIVTSRGEFGYRNLILDAETRFWMGTGTRLRMDVETRFIASLHPFLFRI